MSNPKPTVQELLGSILQQLAANNALGYSEEVAARVSSVGVTTVRRWIEEGLPYIKKGNGDGERSHKIILRSDLEQFLASKRQSETNP